MLTDSPTPAASGDDGIALYTDRDLSLLRFQQRVLEEAQDARTPLLDRVRFLGIVGTNIDDFIMVRAPKLRTDPERRVVIEAVLKRVLRDAQLCWQRQVVPALSGAGIQIVEYSALDDDQRLEVDTHLRQFVAPHLSTFWCDPARPFPQIASLGHNLLVQARSRAGDERLAVVRTPDTLSPLLRCHEHGDPRAAAGGSTPERLYVWLDQVLLANLHAVLPGWAILTAHPFRVFRETDSRDIAAVEAARLESPLEEALAVVRRRDTNPVVALAIDRRMPRTAVATLMQGLDVAESSVHRVRRVGGLRRQWELSRIGRPDLHHPDFTPGTPPRLQDCSDIFAAIRGGDVLLHHPFESFHPVIDFVRQAAEDPDVLGISMTIYRTDRESPVGHALLAAAQHGKRVRVVIELAARFDEERNVSWARRLQEAGAEVSFAPAGLKVHAKMALVVRHEGTRLRRYAHVSSGNYNAFTARVYTDLGLLTCDDEITADVAQLFDILTGVNGSSEFRKIVVAPVALRDTFTALVEREIAWTERGCPGHVILKMNALSDRSIIPLLYRASQAGVRLDLLVRGTCCLRPGLPGVSENIRVRSVLGRFLEHSRVWWFANGGREEVFLGSPDLMPRNLNRRIEIMVPVLDEQLRHRIRHDILGSYLSDNVQARELRADGAYVRLQPAPGDPAINAQSLFLHPQSGALR